MYEEENALIQAGQPQQAIQRLRAALSLRQHDPDCHYTLALALDAHGQTAAAQMGYRSILERWPRYVPAMVALADTLARGQEFQLARRYATLADGIANGRDPYAAAVLAMLDIDELDLEGGLARLDVIAAMTRNAGAASVALGYSLHRGYELARHVDWVDRYQPFAVPPGGRLADLPATARPPLPRWDGRRPLRVGFVGTRTLVSNMFVPVLWTLYGPEDFRLATWVYFDGPPDAIPEAHEAADQWTDSAAMSDQELAAQIRRDGIDVLIDLMGHKRGSRIGVMVLRPAPLAYTYLGYAGDTLLGRNIDQEAGWAYRPDPDAPPVAELPASRNHYTTFGSVNRAAKITPDVMRAWGDIMRLNSTARLIVAIPGGENNHAARQRLEQAGTAGDRLTLVERPPARLDYLRLADRFDLCLDTFPYGGGAVTLDMAWQGVPTIVMGSTGSYQMGPWLAERIGLGDWVARHPAMYRDLAHVSDYGALAQLRASMRDRMAHVTHPAPVAGSIAAIIARDFPRLEPAALEAQPDARPCCE